MENNLPSILGGMAQGFTDFGKGLFDMFGTGGASVLDLIESAKTGNVTNRRQDDFRKWLYQTDSTKDAAAKGLGTALNGVQTVADYIPGVNALTQTTLGNAAQGALGGLADELKTYGEDYDLGRAGQRAAISAAGAAVSGGLADALKGSNNALLSSNTVRGLARGATGGAISGGGYAAIDGGDVLEAAKQGAGMGALIGGATGAFQDFAPRKSTYSAAMTDEQRQARIANIDDQLSKLDTSTPDGNARYNELMQARNRYNQTFYHGTPKNPTESGDTLGSGLYITSNKDRATGYANGGDVSSYDTSGLNIANLDDVIPENVAKVLRDNPELSDKLKTLTPTTETYDLAQRDAAYNRFKALKGEYPRDLIEVKKTNSGFDISYPGDVDYTKITGKDLFRKLNTPDAQDVFMRAGYDGVSKTALGGDTEMAIYRNAPQPLETTLSDADMAVNSPRYLTDENGNPRTFYHGSPNKNITEFDINQAGKNTSSGEHALYFTDSPQVADDFSYERLPGDSMFIENKGAKGRVYPVNLEMNNPLDLDNLSDAQIRELWEYASPLGQLDGQEKFIRNLTDWRDNAHNAQLTKGYLDLDKLRDSQYDGFMARMYPNQDNQAREYAVFDNSKVKMLEDVLANDDMTVNAAKVAPGQLGLFDDMPTQAPKTGTRQTSLFDQPDNPYLDYYGADIDTTPLTPEAPANPYAPVNGEVTQAMRDRAADILGNWKKNGVPENELYNAINQGTLPDKIKSLKEVVDGGAYEKRMKELFGTTDIKKADIGKVIDYIYDTEPARAENIKNNLLAERGGLDKYEQRFRNRMKKGLYEAAQERIANDVGANGLTSSKNIADVSIRQGYTAAADEALSERLGIAPGNTPKYNGAMDTRNAFGRYSHPSYREGGDLAVFERKMSSPEDAISTVAHERLHSFQGELEPRSKGRYDKEVLEAYEQLRRDLAPHYKSWDETAERYGHRDTGYWQSGDEQESRMLQNYLENKGYTDSTHMKSKYRAGEWGNEINPAFDKFFDKLRDLSKRGVALPALAALFGGGAYMASQENDEDKEKEVK